MTDNPFRVGQWVRWSTPDQVKRGKVVLSTGPSIKVHWLGGGEQVFPVVEGYLHGDYRSPLWRIDVIEEPREALSVARDERRGVMSVKRAAALLGTDRKRIRAMLRSGSLRGGQTDGRWSSVNAEDVMSKVSR